MKRRAEGALLSSETAGCLASTLAALRSFEVDSAQPLESTYSSELLGSRGGRKDTASAAWRPTLQREERSLKLAGLET